MSLQSYRQFVRDQSSRKYQKKRYSSYSVAYPSHRIWSGLCIRNQHNAAHSQSNSRPNRHSGKHHQSIRAHPKARSQHGDQTRIPRQRIGLCRWGVQEKTNPWRRSQYRNTEIARPHEISGVDQSHRPDHWAIGIDATNRANKSRHPILKKCDRKIQHPSV